MYPFDVLTKVSKILKHDVLSIVVRFLTLKMDTETYLFHLVTNMTPRNF